ncbi:MAG: BamA/TamA family outer membrane protein [Chitinophagaceae bacterium]
MKQIRLLSILILFACHSLYAQKSKKHISLKDSLDHAFDLSDYIIEANGFVPVPYLITEPALGGFGGMLAPIFIKKRPPYLDSIKGKLVRTPVAPDITGGALFYTANKTWGAGVFRSGTFVKSRIKYMIGGAYANVNMSFYKTFEHLGEKEFKMNIKSFPALLQVTKRIGYSHWYAGLKYFFMKADIKFRGDTSLSILAKPMEFSSIISQLGVLVELDNRDNVFTPNSGMKLHVDALMSDNIFGSDFDYWRFNYYAYYYTKIFHNVIGGFRLDGQQAVSDPPFYMLPYIDMRGIPANRYQGNADILAETEFRWDVVPRWSAVFFGGTGKAFDYWKDFGSTDWQYSYGTGFRYLLARKFNLRVGVDLAHSPGTWAYYIVFGSNWLK